MKIIFKVCIVFYTLMGLSLFASDKILATVNGSEITESEVNEYVTSSLNGATFYGLTQSEKQVAINKMITRKLFLEEAKQINISADPQFIIDLKKKTENLMLDYWMKKKVEEIIVDDREAKIYYRDNREKFEQPASVKVRHILLGTEAEANEIIKELNHYRGNLKEKFISLAKKRSTGPSSVNGGELDWFIQEQMVPEFSEIAFRLKKGKITQNPVQTQFGYHVIYLEDKKEAGTSPFEEVKEGILKKLRFSKLKPKLDKLSKKLRETAKIK